MKTKRLYAPGLSARDLLRDSISSSVPPPLPPAPSWKALSMLDTLRADYSNIEDFSMVPVTFKDDTIADVFALEIVLGGGCAECHYSCAE